jgi:hypothetical protein
VKKTKDYTPIITEMESKHTQTISTFTVLYGNNKYHLPSRNDVLGEALQRKLPKHRQSIILTAMSLRLFVYDRSLLKFNWKRAKELLTDPSNLPLLTNLDSTLLETFWEAIYRAIASDFEHNSSCTQNTKGRKRAVIPNESLAGSNQVSNQVPMSQENLNLACVGVLPYGKITDQVSVSPTSNPSRTVTQQSNEVLYPGYLPFRKGDSSHNQKVTGSEAFPATNWNSTYGQAMIVRQAVMPPPEISNHDVQTSTSKMNHRREDYQLSARQGKLSVIKAKPDSKIRMLSPTEISISIKQGRDRGLSDDWEVVWDKHYNRRVWLSPDGKKRCRGIASALEWQTRKIGMIKKNRVLTPREIKVLMKRSKERGLPSDWRVIWDINCNHTVWVAPDGRKCKSIPEALSIDRLLRKGKLVDASAEAKAKVLSLNTLEGEDENKNTKPDMVGSKTTQQEDKVDDALAEANAKVLSLNILEGEDEDKNVKPDMVDSTATQQEEQAYREEVEQFRDALLAAGLEAADDKLSWSIPQSKC